MLATIGEFSVFTVISTRQNSLDRRNEAVIKKSQSIPFKIVWQTLSRFTNPVEISKGFDPLSTCTLPIQTTYYHLPFCVFND